MISDNFAASDTTTATYLTLTAASHLYCTTMAQARLVLPTYTAKVYEPTEARNFLQDFETFCTAHAVPDAEKPSYLASALKDSARDWLTQFTLDDLDNGTNWATMREAFKETFTAPVPMAHKAQMAADCRQRQDENVRSFAIRVANLAYQIVDGLPPAERPTIPVTVQPPPADGADPPVVAANVTLNDNQTLVVSRPFARKQACILFIAGVKEKIREKLLVNTSWTTWDELKTLAYTVEAAIMPAAVVKQTTKFTTHNVLQPVHAVDAAGAGDQQQQQQQHQQPIAPVSNRGKSNKGKGRGRQQQQNQQDQPRSYKASPHPQQHNSHTAAVTCYYCGGTYHTERHCLAKQSKQATGSTGAVAPQDQQQQQQVFHAQQQQQQLYAGQQQQQLYAGQQQQQPPFQDFYGGV